MEINIYYSTETQNGRTRDFFNIHATQGYQRQVCLREGDEDIRTLKSVLSEGPYNNASISLTQPNRTGKEFRNRITTLQARLREYRLLLS
jgi:hypothetical protein